MGETEEANITIARSAKGEGLGDEKGTPAAFTLGWLPAIVRGDAMNRIAVHQYQEPAREEKRVTRYHKGNMLCKYCI